MMNEFEIKELSLNYLYGPLILGIFGLLLGIYIHDNFLANYYQDLKNFFIIIDGLFFIFFFFLGIKFNNFDYIYSSKIYYRLTGQIPKKFVLGMKEILQNPYINDKEDIPPYSWIYIFPKLFSDLQMCSDISFEAYTTGMIYGLKIYYGKIKKYLLFVFWDPTYEIKHSLMIILPKSIGLGYLKLTEFKEAVNFDVKKKILNNKIADYDSEEVNHDNKKYELVVDKTNLENYQKTKNYLLTLLTFTSCFFKQIEIYVINNLLFISIQNPKEFTEEDPGHILEELIKLIQSM